MVALAAVYPLVLLHLCVCRLHPRNIREKLSQPLPEVRTDPMFGRPFQPQRRRQHQLKVLMQKREGFMWTRMRVTLEQNLNPCPQSPRLKHQQGMHLVCTQPIPPRKTEGWMGFGALPRP